MGPSPSKENSALANPRSAAGGCISKDKRTLRNMVDGGRDEIKASACSKARAGRTAATSRQGSRRASRHKDSRAHGARLEQDARQPRLAKEADGPADTKTRERTEGAATAVQAMHGDSFSANRVDPGPKTTSTSFGVKTEHLALSCRDDVLVENGAAAPKSFLSPFEMHSSTAAGSLVPAGETSTATKTTFNQPPLRLYSTVETNLWTPFLSVAYDSSFLWNNNIFAAPSCRRVIEIKSGQYRMFGRGGSRSSPYLPVFGNVARVVLWGGSLFLERLVMICSIFWRINDSGFKNL